ncbi:MAG: ABC transporter ATP-binding protein/permease [Lachnospiraceae bacterium]|nr:ABC transporter ATP-binding protein/permease [Lachnospiraceae bacterium]
MAKDKITAAGLKKYLSLFEKSGAYWVCLLLIPVTDIFVSIMNALLYQNIVNAVMVSDMDLFYGALWLAGVVLAVNMARCLLIYTYMYHIRQIMKRLRLRVMTHLFHLPMSYFEGHHTADSIQKLCFNVENIKNSLANGHQRVISPIIIGTAAIIMILWLDPRIGIMVLVLSIVSVRINIVLSKPLRGMAVRIQKLLAVCTERLTDILAGLDVIKMFSGARVMAEKYSAANAEVAVETVKRFRRMSDVQAVEWVFGFLCNVVVLLIGVFMSFAGLVDFGTVVAILSLQGMVSYFLSNIGSAWGSLIDAFVLADRVFEILDQPFLQENCRIGSQDTESDLSMENGGIQIKDAVFSYEASERVLNGVDITVEKGRTAALVGESGGGKSTVVKLLMGFYRLDSGSVKVLGRPLSDYTPDELRENIAYVPQDAYLFTTSIKENIRYGRLGASDEEVMEAAKRAYAHEFIMSFPDGYDTLVGERGESLSGGQRQRIAIARAFIRNAPILLLDEATSALDAESEQFVQRGIEALMGGRTTLVVAHRLSTIEKADMIYVIGSGRVCEKGRHTELMEQGGIYKRLVELSGSHVSWKNPSFSSQQNSCR